MQARGVGRKCIISPGRRLHAMRYTCWAGWVILLVILQILRHLAETSHTLVCPLSYVIGRHGAVVFRACPYAFCFSSFPIVNVLSSMLHR